MPDPLNLTPWWGLEYAFNGLRSSLHTVEFEKHEPREHLDDIAEDVVLHLPNPREAWHLQVPGVRRTENKLPPVLCGTQSNSTCGVLQPPADTPFLPHPLFCATQGLPCTCIASLVGILWLHFHPHK